jgi:hypothetical protein
MAEELPESLKKYVPGPLLLILTVVWLFGGDRIKDWVQARITEPDAHILVEDKTDSHVVRIEISPHSKKSFEEVQVVIGLRVKPAGIKGTLTNVEGAKRPLICVARDEKGAVIVCSKAGVQGSPITMRQQESMEIALDEGVSPAVLGVSIIAKDREEIDWSDLNQKYRLPEFAWRAGLVILGICAIYYFYHFLLYLLSRRARKQLEEDIKFLHKCWQGDATALATFDTELQPVVDAGTAEYLKAFSPVVRNNNRLHVIPQQIFERAETLPKFRRSLKGEVQRFVITFCLDFVEHEYKALKNIAKKELARIR